MIYEKNYKKAFRFRLVYRDEVQISTTDIHVMDKTYVIRSFRDKNNMIFYNALDLCNMISTRVNNRIKYYIWKRTSDPMFRNECCIYSRENSCPSIYITWNIFHLYLDDTRHSKHSISKIIDILKSRMHPNAESNKEDEVQFAEKKQQSRYAACKNDTASVVATVNVCPICHKVITKSHSGCQLLKRYPRHSEILEGLSTFSNAFIIQVICDLYNISQKVVSLFIRYSTNEITVEMKNGVRGKIAVIYTDLFERILTKVNESNTPYAEDNVYAMLVRRIADHIKED